MKAIDFWRLADDLTIVQAALLICGCDPSDYQDTVRGNYSSLPDGYAAAKHALVSAVASNKLDARTHYERDQHGEGYEIEDLAQIPVSAIREWLTGKGFKEHFFFLPFEPKDEFLSPEHPRYSAKLAAAVTAWRELDDPTLLKGTPKQSLQKWLRLNAVEYGLCDEDGKPTESAITDIAKIANWKTKGGAPATPSTAGLIEPDASLSRNTTGSDSLSVKAQQPFDPDAIIEYNLADEIPF